MTEDEAFIRTIVDSPGDDLPRLVLADWLDERNDPRGAYLRAELEWAKGRRIIGLLLGLDSRMHKMAEGLDPVWVARVSRPPVGVCADHLKWENPGDSLVAAQLVATITQLGHDLPVEYAAFLLNYNGGRPTPNQFDVGLRRATVDVFTSVVHSSNGGCVDLLAATMEVRTRCRLSSSWVVVGWSNTPNVYWEQSTLCQEAFLVSVKKSSKAFGKVVYWSDVSPRGLTRESRAIAGGSFPDLLNLLRPQSK